MNQDEFDEKIHEEMDQAFEEKIKQAIKAMYRPVTPPDSTESFHRLLKKLEHRRKRQRRNRWLKMVATAVIFMSLGAMLFGNMQPTQAVHSMYQFMKNVQENVIQVVFRSNPDQSETNGAKTPPPPPNDEVSGPIVHEGGYSIRKTVSLSEAIEEASFDLYVLEDVPEGFELERIETFYMVNKEQAHMVTMGFENKNDKSSFRIMQTVMEGDNFSISFGMNPASGDMENIHIQGYPANLILFIDGRTNIKWLMERVFFNMSGDIDKQQAISIAEALRKVEG